MSDALADYYNDIPPTITPLPATEHQHDPGMERLIELRTNDPAAFDRLPATSRIALGHYEQRRPE
jgi:hypothetical protein